jgi:hypothetical protein
MGEGRCTGGLGEELPTMWSELPNVELIIMILFTRLLLPIVHGCIGDTLSCVNFDITRHL